MHCQIKNKFNTVVSNHFHSVKNFYFRLPNHVILMECFALDFRYTAKTPIDKCRFNVASERIFYIFCKKHISIKLFYLYQRFQFTDNYFFKIKFVLFLYLLLSALWKKNDLSWYISIIRQTVGYRTPVFTQPFSWRLHIQGGQRTSCIRVFFLVENFIMARIFQLSDKIKLIFILF